MTGKYELLVDGNTKAIKNGLKARGFRWVYEELAWRKRISEADYSAIMAGGQSRKDKLIALDVRFRGCQVSAGWAGTHGDVVYTSPTFAGSSLHEPRGVAIPGSAPDDRI